MPKARLREQLASGETSFGSFVFSSDPAITEILAHAGYQFAIVDLEHASLGLAEAVAHIRAGAAAGIAVLARVHGPNAPEIVQLLDAGAAGIVLPHFGLDRAASVAAVDSMRYSPRGSRPTCTGTRAASFGLSDFSAYARDSNDNVIAVGLVEDAAVLAELPELLAECRVDLLMAGAADLSASLGMPGEMGHERVRAAIARVLKCGRDAGIPIAVYARNDADLEPWRSLEPEAVVVSIDYRVLALAYRGLREGLRAVRTPGVRDKVPAGS